jgi:hypothetical protein
MQGRNFQLETNVCVNFQENTEYRDSGCMLVFDGTIQRSGIVVTSRGYVGIRECEISALKVKKKYIKNTKNILWKMYFLKIATSLSDCGHINELLVVKISNFYLK